MAVALNFHGDRVMKRREKLFCLNGVDSLREKAALDSAYNINEGYLRSEIENELIKIFLIDDLEFPAYILTQRIIEFHKGWVAAIHQS